MNNIVKEAVNRFLNWKLPEDFSPDGGVSFEPLGNKGTQHEFKRDVWGTNLLTAVQATEMFEHCLPGLGFTPKSNNEHSRIFDAGTIEGLLEDSLNAACLAVQQKVGQTDGGFAGVYWTGHNRDDFERLIVDYAVAELHASFQRFQSSRQMTFNVGRDIPNGMWDEEDNRRGFIYMDCLFIELHDSGEFGVEICRDGHVSHNLQEVELRLFDFAVDEGHMERTNGK